MPYNSNYFPSNTYICFQNNLSSSLGTHTRALSSVFQINFFFCEWLESSQPNGSHKFSIELLWKLWNLFANNMAIKKFTKHIHTHTPTHICRHFYCLNNDDKASEHHLYRAPRSFVTDPKKWMRLKKQKTKKKKKQRMPTPVYKCDNSAINTLVWQHLLLIAVGDSKGADARNNQQPAAEALLNLFAHSIPDFQMDCHKLCLFNFINERQIEQRNRKKSTKQCNIWS